MPNGPTHREQRFGLTPPKSEEHAIVLWGAVVPKRLPRSSPYSVALATACTCGAYGVYWLYRWAKESPRAQFGRPRNAHVIAIVALCTLFVSGELVLFSFAKAAEPHLAAGAPAQRIAWWLRRLTLLAVLFPPLLIVTLALAQALVNAIDAEAIRRHAGESRRRPATPSR